MTALYRDTPHGFRFGPAEVTAAMSIEWRKGAGEHVAFRLRTDAGKTLDIYVSPTGRSVRVFRDHVELTP